MLCGGSGARGAGPLPHGKGAAPRAARAASDRLGAGDTFSGPAIVEEFGSTVPVHPGFVVRVDEYGNLVIQKEGALR